MNFHKLRVLSPFATSILERISILGPSQGVNFCLNTKENTGAWKPKTRVTELLHERYLKEAKRLATLLRIDEESAFKLIRKKRYLSVAKDESILQCVEVLRQHGVPDEYIVNSPDCIGTNFVRLKNDLLICREVGIELLGNVYQTSDEAHEKQLYTRSYFKLRDFNVKFLKETEVIPQNFCVLTNLITTLKMNETSVKSLYDSLPSNYEEELSLGKLRRKVLQHYLAAVLECDLSKAQKIINEYSSTLNRCFEWVRRSYEILTRQLGFTANHTILELPRRLTAYLLYKLCRSYAVLHLGRSFIFISRCLFSLHPDELTETLLKVKTLAGMPVAEAFRRRPQILNKKASSYLEIERLVLAHGYSKECLSKRLEVFLLNPNTVKERLEEIDANPQLRVLKSHPDPLALLHRFKRCQVRQKELPTIKTSVVNPSLNILTVNNRGYDRFLASGRKLRGKELVHVLMPYFSGKSFTEIRSRLIVNPYWADIPVIKAEEVLTYIIASLMDVSQDTLFDALPIILYPLDKVKDSVKCTIEKGEASLGDSYFLHMVLYFLDKHYHFSKHGNQLPAAVVKNDSENGLHRNEK